GEGAQLGGDDAEDLAGCVAAEPGGEGEEEADGGEEGEGDPIAPPPPSAPGRGGVGGDRPLALAHASGGDHHAENANEVVEHQEEGLHCPTDQVRSPADGGGGRARAGGSAEAEDPEGDVHVDRHGDGEEEQAEVELDLPQ